MYCVFLGAWTTKLCIFLLVLHDKLLLSYTYNKNNLSYLRQDLRKPLVNNNLVLSCYQNSVGARR